MRPRSKMRSPGPGKLNTLLVAPAARFDDVWSINADGTDLTRLTRSPEPEFDPTWSPDGTQIAFRFERNGDPEIWLMNADGSDRRR
jgi:TolB protein